MINSLKKTFKLTALLSVFILFTSICLAQDLAILKYKGGGDWYSNPTALTNLINFCNTNINTKINKKPETVEASSTDIFQYPLLHMTGHGNVLFSNEETRNLRLYLESGGFLHIDDNYGMKTYITRELKKVFPNQELKELPANHKIFNTAFKFVNGLPKIHEHDGKRPQALALFHQSRLVVLLTIESDLGDGWEDQEVHNDPEDIRLKALQMGANIVKYAFEN